jgi:hypothetical protein
VRIERLTEPGLHLRGICVPTWRRNKLSYMTDIINEGQTQKKRQAFSISSLWKRLPRFTLRSVPFVLLVVCLAGFGLLIPWLGFYQDDWYQIWFERAFGRGVFVDFFAIERPFIAAIYMLTTPLVGTTPLNWQIFGLFSRWLAALAVWWTLKTTWPRNSRLALWVTLVFALYPGFRQQWVAVIYSQYFLQMAAQVASLGVMVLAVRQPRRRWWLTALALLLAFFGLFTSEYFFGLELMRPLFLWVALQGEDGLPMKARLKKTLARWSPYLVLTLAFLSWRVVLFKFPTYRPFFLAESNLTAARVFSLLLEIVRSALEVGMLAWFKPLSTFAQIGLSNPWTQAALALAALVTLLTAVYLGRLSAPDEGSQGQREALADQAARQFIAIGLFGLLVSGLPFWLVGLPVDTRLESGSRFTISFMLSASLLVVGLVNLVLRDKGHKAATIAIIAGLAVGGHFIDANTYRVVHRSQSDFFQQLVWRAPALEPGSLILTNMFDEPLSGDNSMTAAFNWIYDPAPPYSLQYMLFYLPNRLEIGSLPGLAPGLPVNKPFRTTEFHGSTSQVLVIDYNQPQCLHVLDPANDLVASKQAAISPALRDAALLSNLAQIQTSLPPVELPAKLFQSEAGEQTWCYFFEKADLARQIGDWQEIVRLGEQAFSREPKMERTWEVLPFVEGYARAGQPGRALELTHQALQVGGQNSTQTGDLLCAVWQQIQMDPQTSSGLKAFAREVASELTCP